MSGDGLQLYIHTTHSEHIVCFIPTNDRSWKLVFSPVVLPKDTMRRYQQIVEAFIQRHQSSASGVTGGGSSHETTAASIRAGGGCGYHRLYSDLKAFLRSEYDPDVFIRAMKDEVQRNRDDGRRVLVFANRWSNVTCACTDRKYG